MSLEKMDLIPQETDKETAPDNGLTELWKTTDNAARYSTDIDMAKQTAENIAQELFLLKATDLPPESDLGQAYLSAKKIAESYTDLEQAKSALRRISELLHNQMTELEEESPVE